MSSIIEGYNYDIFISYRQKDNKGDRWVSEFVEALRTELESTFKDEISVYFDINPYDGLLETYDVDASLKEKLKCLIFIPVISRTYCDPKSFAWEHEFRAFVEMASKDQFGLKIILPNGNVASRVLPICIHDLDIEDTKLCKTVTGGFLRGVEFIYKEQGVNRPLRSNEDNPHDNLNHTIYRNQINKVALAIKEIISAVTIQSRTDKKSDRSLVADKSVLSRQQIQESAVTSLVFRTIRKRTIVISGIILTAVIAIVFLIVYNNGNGAKLTKVRTIESLVILPFGNYTGADEMEPMVSGMHAYLIADLGRISELRVINSTTSNVYKNARMSVHQIAEELEVDGALEVSVFGLQDSIIIQVSLISAFPKEEIIWTSNYREEKSQILNLYNCITKQIADQVKIKLTVDEENLLAESSKVEPEAVFAFMKGQFHFERQGKQDLDSALHYFQVAIKKDPSWADPYGGLSITWLTIGDKIYAPMADSYEKAWEYLKKSLELNPNTATSHYIKAQIEMRRWEWQESEKEFLKTLELNPNNALGRVAYAHLLAILRREDESIHQADIALALDPFHPWVIGRYAYIMFYVGRYQAALNQAEKANSIDPESQFVSDILARVYLKSGDTLKWHKLMKRHWYWADEKYLAHLDTVFMKGGYLAVIEDRIRVNEDVYSKGGNISFIGQARRYLEVRNYDKALDYFEKAYEERSGPLGAVSLEVIQYPELAYNQRYVALLKKMNLPLK
jgi:adenylate cyclase